MDLAFDVRVDESASFAAGPTKKVRIDAGAVPKEGAMKPIQGYVRSDVPLRILDTALHKSSSDPSVGVLEISTEDGVLRLAISRDAVQDLQIDLNQFSEE